MNEDDLMIQTNLATDEMVEPEDQEMEEQPNPIQVLCLVNRQTIVCEIDEVLADIGQPDCKMINPVFKMLFIFYIILLREKFKK